MVDSYRKQSAFFHGIRHKIKNKKNLVRDYLDPPHVIGQVTWEWHIQADTVIYSREWRHILQDTDDSSLGPSWAHWWPRMHEEDVEPFVQMARDIIEGRTEHFRALCRLQRNDGTWAWIFSKGTVTEKSEGKAVQVLGALMDVSELREDVKFQHGNILPGIARTAVKLDSAPDLVVRMDRNLAPLVNNAALARLLFGSRTETSGDSLSPAQLSFLREKVEKVYASGLPEREVISLPTRYGHEVTGEYAFWPEFDQNGQVTAVMAQFRDTTEQVLVERRARLNEMRLDSLYRLTQMDSADEKSVLQFVMDSLIRLTGSEHCFLFFPQRSPDDTGRVVWSESLHGLLPEKILSGDEPCVELRQLVMEKAASLNYRFIQNGNGLHPVFQVSGGQLRVIRHAIAPAVDDGQAMCIAGVCNKNRDYATADLHQLETFINGAWLILRRHEHMREIQRAKEAAEQASRVKDIFLANISHELRTPLNGMLSMLQLLPSSSLKKEQQQYVRAAEFSGQTLLRIISDILDFSHMASGKMALRREPFDLKLCMESCLKLFQREARKKGLGFTVRMDSDIPAVLMGDDARVMQVVFNIVGNALKFTEKGGIQVDCSLDTGSSEGEVNIRLQVADTGIGIQRDKLDNIFEAFTQIDSSSTRRYPGTGLGLGITRELMRLMGGSIAIESEEGKGTTLLCTFCFTEPAGELLPDQVALTSPQKTVMHSMDILVAEDDAVSSLALRRFLEKMGQRAVCVSNGKLALEVLQLYPFHCLFTDIQMPVMDGMELIQSIRENRAWDARPSQDARDILSQAFPGECTEPVPVPKNLPTVIVSAHAMSGDRERFLEAGADYYMPKPITLKDLSAVLQRIAAQLMIQEKLLPETYASTHKKPSSST